MTPLRIAVIGPRGVPSTYSGIERAVESLYALLAERGHRITLYARPEYAPDAERVYRGIRVLGIPTLESRSLGTVSQVAASALHTVWAQDYDLVHMHALAPGLVSPLLRRFRLPTVATIQGVDWQRAKWRGLGSVVLRRAERWLVRNVDEMIVVSRDLEAHYSREYGRCTRLIPNGTEITAARPLDDALLARFGLEPNRYVVFVARLVPEKRAGDLIRAFRAVSTSHRLAIVGGSSHTDDHVVELRALAAGDDRIVFTGTQPREAVATLTRGATVFVLPSELEGMSMALLESLEAGTPAIVSALPVHREVLDPVDGYDLFFPPGDVDALQERLVRALGAETHYRAVAARARAHVHAEYSWQVIADRTEALYREVLQRRRLPRAGAAR